jgi:hypothetical protein
MTPVCAYALFDDFGRNISGREAYERMLPPFAGTFCANHDYKCSGWPDWNFLPHAVNGDGIGAARMALDRRQQSIQLVAAQLASGVAGAYVCVPAGGCEKCHGCPTTWRQLSLLLPPLPAAFFLEIEGSELLTVDAFITSGNLRCVLPEHLFAAGAAPSVLERTYVLSSIFLWSSGHFSALCFDMNDAIALGGQPSWLFYDDNKNNGAAVRLQNMDVRAVTACAALHRQYGPWQPFVGLYVQLARLSASIAAVVCIDKLSD